MLIKCPECELQVSDKAISCPHCGYPLKTGAKSRPKTSKKRRRLPNGFGQISEIKGKNLRNPYRAMISVGKDENGRPICKPLKPQSYFSTYNDAYAALVEYNRNPFEVSENITCKELYDRWSSKYYETAKPSSVRTYKLAWKYCTVVCNLSVRNIRPRHIKACMEEGVATICGRQKTPSARNKTEIKMLFNQMLDYAVEYDIVENNCSRQFSLDKNIIKEKCKVQQEHIPFTDEEMEMLWKYNGKLDGVDILLIQCYSGWRPSELSLLKIEDVDLDNWTFKGGIKTEAGENRIVPIHPRIRDMVVAEYNRSVQAGSEYLFTHINKFGGPGMMTYGKYSQLFRNIKNQLEFNPEHRPHDGRKHFITMAKEAKMDEYAIKYIVGHKIDDITEKVYTQRKPSWYQEEMQKIK